MARLSEKYRSEIARWNWDGIKSSAKENAEPSGDGGSVGREFLGTVFSIFPSGKFYTAFALGNLDYCHSCKGEGETRKKYPCEPCAGSGMRMDSQNWLHAHKVGNALSHQEVFPCWVCHGTGHINKPCRQCGGLGSQEAYRDSVFLEALEDKARKEGGWIESGEGASCDLFFCLPVGRE